MADIPVTSTTRSLGARPQQAPPRSRGPARPLTALAAPPLRARALLACAPGACGACVVPAAVRAPPPSTTCCWLLLVAFASGACFGPGSPSRADAPPKQHESMLLGMDGTYCVVSRRLEGEGEGERGNCCMRIAGAYLREVCPRGAGGSE